MLNVGRTACSAQTDILLLRGCGSGMEPPFLHFEHTGDVIEALSAQQVYRMH